MNKDSKERLAQLEHKVNMLQVELSMIKNQIRMIELINTITMEAK